MKARIMGTPSPTLAAPPMAAMISTWLPVSAPMPWIIPTPKAVRGPYALASSGSTCSCPWIRAPSQRQA